MLNGMKNILSIMRIVLTVLLAVYLTACGGGSDDGGGGGEDKSALLPDIALE